MLLYSHCLVLFAGAVAVAEFVAESPRLLRLDVRENEIKTGGLMALSLALRVNQSLLRLDLDREPKKETVRVAHFSSVNHHFFFIEGYKIARNFA